MLVRTENLELVEVIPVEYQYNIPLPRHPRILRYRKISYSDLCKQGLEKIVADLSEKLSDERLMASTSVHVINGRYISYQYGNFPRIFWEPSTKKIMVTKQTLTKFEEGKCQQQASLFMRLIQEYGYVKFERISITFNPDRMGKTLEDLEITFNALRRIFQTYITKQVE